MAFFLASSIAMSVLPSTAASPAEMSSFSRSEVAIASAVFAKKREASGELLREAPATLMLKLFRRSKATAAFDNGKIAACGCLLGEEARSAEVKVARG